MDIEEFRLCSKNLIDFICDYRKTLDSKKLYEPKLGLLKANVPNVPPENPIIWDNILENYETLFMKGLPNTSHKHLFEDPVMGDSLISMMANMLTDGIGSIPTTSDSNTPYHELSKIMTDWICKALDLPAVYLNDNEGGGYLQISKMHSTLNVLLAARNHMLKKHQLKFEKENCSRLMAYCTNDTYYLIKKSMHLILINIHIVNMNPDNTINVADLEKNIESDIAEGYTPVFLSANFGTETGSIDDLERLGKICEKYDIWYHVDASYAGFGMICPEIREYAKGIEYADSIGVNADIWGLVHPYCTCLFVKDKDKTISSLKTKLDSNINETNKWMSSVEPYKAVNIWFVLQSYGMSGIREYQRKHMRYAKYIEGILKRDDNFEVCNDVLYNVVCFRLKDMNNAVNENFYDTLNKSGDIRVSANEIGDKFVLVLHVGTEHTDETDIDKAYDAIKKCAENVKNECTCLKNN